MTMAAQDAPKPAAKAAPSESPSKWDIFAGYSYLAPHGTVTAYGVPHAYESIDYGAILSVARYFNNYVGAQLEADEHVESESWIRPGDKNPNVSSTNSDDDFSGGGAGLIFRVPTEDITPFVHGLVGLERVGSLWQSERFGAVLTVGGGLDYATPFFDHHLAIRVFQADYQYSHENFGQQGRGNFNMARLSAGFVYHIGSIAPPPPVTLACSVNPTSVFPGDPVAATATAGMLNPKMTAVYTWTGTGVTGSGATATVATAGLAPGSYTVSVNVKEGPKAGQSADCSAPFTVKAYEPPTLSCSASPSTIKPGESSTITAVGVSPQNRPLTYTYSAAAGSIDGTGTTATFSSTGAPTGPVSITCNVADDKGQTATANTGVTITSPYVAPIPHTQALCSITFEKDKKRPERVDNDAKACLDEVALDLQKQADASAMIVGDSTSAEKTPAKKGKKKAMMAEDFAAQRAVNTKDYLVTEKGIDASRIKVSTGTADAQKVEDYLVPSGATFTSDVPGTSPVDESMVKPQARKSLAAAPMHKAHMSMKPHAVGDSAKPPVTHGMAKKKKAAKAAPAQ
jgi:hypothetical protein